LVLERGISSTREAWKKPGANILSPSENSKKKQGDEEPGGGRRSGGGKERGEMPTVNGGGINGSGGESNLRVIGKCGSKSEKTGLRGDLASGTGSENGLGGGWEK